MPLIPSVLGFYLGVSKFKRTGLDKLTNSLILWVSSHSPAICGVLWGGTYFASLQAQALSHEPQASFCEPQKIRAKKSKNGHDALNMVFVHAGTGGKCQVKLGYKGLTHGEMGR